MIAAFYDCKFRRKQITTKEFTSTNHIRAGSPLCLHNLTSAVSALQPAPHTPPPSTGRPDQQERSSVSVQHTHVSVLLNISDLFSAQTVSLINTDPSADLDFSVDVPRSPAATRSGLQEEPEVSSLRGTSKRGCVLCADCECSAAGTVENSCRADPRTGTCICKPGFTGDHCDACAPGFYGLSCEGETCTFKPNTSGTSARLHETHELQKAAFSSPPISN